MKKRTVFFSRVWPVAAARHVGGDASPTSGLGIDCAAGSVKQFSQAVSTATLLPFLFFWDSFGLLGGAMQFRSFLRAKSLQGNDAQGRSG